MSKNKFINLLTLDNKGIKSTRAEALSNSVKLEQETLLNEKKRNVLTLEAELERMTDLAPETRESLRPGGKGFDAVDWVRNLHAVKTKLVEAKIHQKIAEETYAEWFGEVAEKAV